MGRLRTFGFGTVAQVLAVAAVILVSTVQPVMLVALGVLATAKAGLAEWRAKMRVNKPEPDVASEPVDVAPAPVHRDFISAMSVKYAEREADAPIVVVAASPKRAPMRAVAALTAVAVIGGAGWAYTDDAARGVAMQNWQVVAALVQEKLQAYGVGEAEVASVEATVPAVAAVAAPVVVAVEAVEAPVVAVAIQEVPQHVPTSAVAAAAFVDGFARVKAYWFAFWAAPQLVMGVGVMIALFSAGGLLLASHHRAVAARAEQIDPFERLLRRRLAEQAQGLETRLAARVLHRA